MRAPPRASCRPTQAAGRGAASAARPDVTDFRRSDEDHAGERRQDAADGTAARAHHSSSISVSISNLKSNSNSESEVQDLSNGGMAEWGSFDPMFAFDEAAGRRRPQPISYHARMTAVRATLLVLLATLLTACGHPLIVQDTDGHPIAGASVTAQRFDVAAPERLEPTDAQGATRLTRALEGSLETVTISKAGYETKRVPAHVLLNERPAIVVLRPGDEP
jgi:hypothetical protein